MDEPGCLRQLVPELVGGAVHGLAEPRHVVGAGGLLLLGELARLVDHMPGRLARGRRHVAGHRREVLRALAGASRPSRAFALLDRVHECPSPARTDPRGCQLEWRGGRRTRIQLTVRGRLRSATSPPNAREGSSVAARGDIKHASGTRRCVATEGAKPHRHRAPSGSFAAPGTNDANDTRRPEPFRSPSVWRAKPRRPGASIARANS